ncbi:MAG: hypothetical protein FWG83_00325 [Oscillospiraceae bacterium]|nr:hypothetical protein [Oscillospiraceae bacterium]
MKKMVKLMSIIVAIAMIASLAVSASASAGTPNTAGEKGIVFGFVNNDPTKLALIVPDGGTTGIAGWGFVDIKIVPPAGGTINARPSAADEDLDITNTPGSSVVEGTYGGGVVFPEFFAGGFVVATWNVTGTGDFVITGDYTYDPEGADNEDFTLNLTVSNVFGSTETTVATQETAAPTETTEGGTEEGTQATAAPTAAPTAAATTTSGTTPKGGVALAIIPTLAAAGAAVFAASRKRK